MEGMRERWERSASSLDVFFLIGSIFLFFSYTHHKSIDLIPARILDLKTEKKNFAIQVLVNIGAPAVEPLIAVLNDEDPSVRAGAVTALMQIRNIRAVEPLIAILNDEDPAVRVQVVAALGWLEDKRAVQPLIARLDDNDQAVRVGVAQALVRMGDERAVEPLMNAITNRDLQVIASESAFFIKRGKAGDEPVFIEALFAHGSQETANNFLNCGNIELENAAREWAKLHGYTISKSSSQDSVNWGRE
jgi:hypothetical protein